MRERPKIGLVLGAGGARGYAHIDVLQVLLEEGVPIDVLTGCSMGSLIGALYVTGADMYFLEKFARSFDIMRYVDFSIKNGGFLRGKKIEQLIRVLTKGMHTEEAQIPYACVAVDIQSGEVVTFRKGALSQTVRASISIPGIFTPYKIDGRTYIDGGVLERLPIRAARELGADRVIAVDVNYRGQEQPVPRNLVETLMFTLNITDWYITRQKEREADVLVLPDVFEVDPFTFQDAQLAVTRGREAAKQALPAIRVLVEGGSDE